MSRRVTGWVVTGVLVVAALVPIGWFGFSAATGATLIVFRTGSMAPAMPQGAVAITVPISADQLRVDDVVTVQRGTDVLPVTHRVVEIRSTGHSATRELVLKGDDNTGVDLHTYVVAEAPRVVAAAPHVGAVLMVVQSPLGMGVLVLVAGALTVWAFWPRSARAADVSAGDDDVRQRARERVR